VVQTACAELKTGARSRLLVSDIKLSRNRKYKLYQNNRTYKGPETNQGLQTTLTVLCTTSYTALHTLHGLGTTTTTVSWQLHTTTCIKNWSKVLLPASPLLVATCTFGLGKKMLEFPSLPAPSPYHHVSGDTNAVKLPTLTGHRQKKLSKMPAFLAGLNCHQHNFLSHSHSESTCRSWCSPAV